MPSKVMFSTKLSEASEARNQAPPVHDRHVKMSVQLGLRIYLSSKYPCSWQHQDSRSHPVLHIQGRGGAQLTAE